MRFAVAEQDTALAEAAGEVLDREVDAEVVRAGWPGAAPHGGPGDRVGAVWRTLAQVGITGALVPQTIDGFGLGLDERALPPLMETLGRSGLPVPAAEVVAVGAPLLAAAGATSYLDAVVDGTALLAVGLTEGAAVPFAARADLIVVRVGGQARLYERGEVRVEPLAAVDGSRHLGRVTAPPAGGLVLAGEEALDVPWRRGVLATSGLLVGLAGRMLELTVGYVRERHQFGVPVGSFQAVKHALADAGTAVRFARPAVLAAGWAQATGAPDAELRTSMAKVLASDAARQVARTAIQCHGAIGYTTEYDLHLYAKRAWALAADWGGPAYHRERIARRLGLTPTP
ncbi:acyl-CoA dehydrogenase family protein [Streptomyces sp. NPDC093795]|uniref:acyl-CoA dehydrogenase family protein n=1 Tax=Streptomyces sp. NPDC093795 TaxID=3366051 RepID=UPI0037F418E5